MKNGKIGVIVMSILSALCTYIQAQPFRHFALTSGIVRTINCDTAGVSEGASGANVTWTISLTPHDTQQFTDNSVLPAATPYGASYPTATNATFGIGRNIAYTYYRVAVDSLITLGYADSQITLVYSNPELSALSSLSFGNSFTDTYAYTESTTVSTATFVSKVSVTRTVTFDGTGTLVLPWKTFSHAMRYKAVSSQTDSTMLGTIPTSVLKTDITGFSWVDTTAPDNTGFSITRTTNTTAAISITSTVVGYSEPVATAVFRSRLNGTAGPSGAVVVSPIDNFNGVRILSSARFSRVQFIAYNLNGRTVATALCTPDGSGFTSGPLRTSLTEGIYLYSIKAGDEIVASGKVIVR